MYWVGKWSFYPTWLGKGGHYSYDFQPLVHGSRKQQPYQKKFKKRRWEESTRRELDEQNLSRVSRPL